MIEHKRKVAIQGNDLLSFYDQRLERLAASEKRHSSFSISSACQRFENESLFFRFETSIAADRVAALKVWTTLPSQLRIADRQHLGKDYPNSFVGSEAVSQIARQHSLHRHDAWIILHRFERLGLIEHVAHERGFIDGHYFYHFA
jgi:hypothetical protein